ncbi:MAG TPA: T9SS type A sorting domain-containing protein [candidate division WOR-3 bacterium]|uniref:T9SS type A sorting domain-containing protein n=1 Tax=candidate division WOR-3 bacterium TaxID=2052148 RepID=A0A9C9K001_UNCW3|nr:T9SS type A sorting domain-containing protein [candidate division WOR-3 bacterium]
MLNKIITYLFLITILFGERITIVRNKIINNPPQPPQAALTLKFLDSGSTMSVKRFQSMRLFRNFKLPPKIGEGKATLKVLVLRVEFVEDDDPTTTGNGKMDLIGFGEPEDGLYYDPPHSKVYFQRQMQFLSNFYKSNSFGNLIVEATVKPDQPTACYQLPHKMAYYSGFDHYDESTGFVYYNTYGMEMGLVRILADAVAAADQDPTVDFSDYDALLIFHAGTLLQTSLNFYRFRDLPSATIPEGALEYYLGTPYILANSGTDTIRGAGINAEMARVDEYMVGAVGTIVHEFGHTLGLPDLYDVSGWSNGVGAWDLMCTGAWVGSPYEGAPEGSIPANLGAWCRYALGWVNPVVVTDPESLLTLRASEIDTTQYGVADQTMIKIPISESEFFLIENRQQDIRQKDTIVIDAEDGVPISVDYGEYDFFLPGSGILIWHIDDDVLDSNWTYNTVQTDPKHKGIDLEEADGIQHFDAWWYGDSLEYYGSRYDPFFVDDSGKSNHMFGPFTNPNSDAYYGKSLINIEVTSKRDTLMNFSFDLGIYQEGFPVLVRRFNEINSLSYGDLDGDGDYEIVAAVKNGSVYAYNDDGSLYATYSSFNRLSSFLAVGDVNNDGADDILFATGFDLVCLDGRDLTPLPGFSFSADNDILGAPLLFDINDDSHLEIIVGSKDRHLYCLDTAGNNLPHFPIYLNTEILSTPCVFDTAQRIIGLLGSDGRFWLIDKNGIIKEFTDSQHNMLTFSSPVVGDIDRDGAPEAVVINGFGTIYIYSKDSLEQKFDILIDTTFYITPALADVDNDGYLEIIMPNSSKTLYVNNRNGTLENNFPVLYDDYIYYPNLAADLNGDNRVELIFGLGCSDSLGEGSLKIINDRNKEFEFSPLFGEDGFTSPGVIFDLDGDGDLELACGSDFGKLYVWDFPGTDASWTGYMNSPKNWGIFKGELVQLQTAGGLLGNFYIYPSPVKKDGVVRFYLHEEADISVEILDLVGHKIGGEQLNNATPNEYNEVAFNFEKQTNGIYILRIEAKNGSKKEVKCKKFAVLK